MRHQSEDCALPYRAADLCGREMDVELVAIAVCVPLRMLQSKWSDFIIVTVVRNSGSVLRDAQDVMWIDSEKHTLSDTFLSETCAIDRHILILKFQVIADRRPLFSWVLSGCDRSFHGTLNSCFQMLS